MKKSSEQAQKNLLKVLKVHDDRVTPLHDDQIPRLMMSPRFSSSRSSSSSSSKQQQQQQLQQQQQQLQAATACDDIAIRFCLKAPPCLSLALHRTIMSFPAAGGSSAGGRQGEGEGSSGPKPPGAQRARARWPTTRRVTFCCR
jgi:hypothetical protein